jgi:Tfp pilus assembly protein PilX
MTNRLRRIHDDEQGIALIVVMAMLVVLGTIAAAVFTNALQIKQATASERASKQAYGAAVNGLRSAMYWLNASVPTDTVCPPLPGQSGAQAPDPTNGLCGPYESDNVSGVPGLATQPLVDQRYTYWITPKLSSATDTCTGRPPLAVDTSVVVRDRCITAIGQSLLGNKVTGTKRVQARVSATNAFFPVPGIFGASCLSIGVSAQPGTQGCQTGSGVSNSDYYGTIGSNGRVNAQMKNWNFDPSTNTVAPARLFLGYTSPTSATVAPYSIRLQNNPPGTPVPVGCGGSTLEYCNNSQPPLPYNTSASGPYQNPVHFFGRWYQPFRMGDMFAQPKPFILGGHLLPTGCTTTDVSVCNNNSLITSASSTPAGCATLSSNRVLTLALGCTIKVPNGIYDFCDINLDRDTVLLPLDTSANAEVRIYLDSKNRTVAGAPACASTTQGTILWPNSSHLPRWFTNNPNAVTAPDCLNAFNGDPWTALGGQLYVYGAGDPADATTNYPVNVNSALDIIGVNFNGAIFATNSTVNLTDSNTCVHGGIVAGAINIANNAGFRWDPLIGQMFDSQTANTYYRTAFSTCAAAGFTDPARGSTYPTYPSDGC